MDLDGRLVAQDCDLSVGDDLDGCDRLEPSVVDDAGDDPADVLGLGPGAAARVDQYEVLGVQEVQFMRICADEGLQATDLKMSDLSLKGHPGDRSRTLVSGRPTRSGSPSHAIDHCGRASRAVKFLHSGLSS